MSMRATVLITLMVLVLNLAGCVTHAPQKETEVTPPKPPPIQYVEKPLMPSTGDWVLLPNPRQMEISSTAHVVLADAGVRFEGVTNTTPIRATLVDALGLKDDMSHNGSAVLFRVDTKTMPHAQGYTITIDAKGIGVVAHDDPGLFYAVMTLKQIARLCPVKGMLPCLKIEDWPDFPNRGVMLDISRSRVPTMETLYALVDMLSEWKINQFQLYTEHSFAYRDHPMVWKEASPMTPEQIRALDAYCKDRWVELVPNQNSFGHMERWLKFPEYQSLGEKPDGGSELCPTNPACVEFLRGLYKDLLPNFSSKQINVGCDETYSIGKGRSKAAVEAQGVGKVYLDFLLKIYGLTQEQGRTMQFWGDIILSEPELIPALKGKNIIALEWGYENDHPFAKHTRQFAESGIPFYVAPGTSSWDDIAGRTDNAVENLRNAAENGLANGAIGYLVTDWGDNGSWQAPATSYLGFAYGAGVCWAFTTNQNMNIPHTLDAQVFQDSAGVMGKLVYDLGNTTEQLGEQYNHKLLLQLIRNANLADKKTKKRLEDIGTNQFNDAIVYLNQVMAPLNQAKMARPDADLIRQHCQMTASLVRFGCHLGIARLNAGCVATDQLSPPIRHALAVELEPLVPELKEIWLKANREGGLNESTDPLDRLLKMLKQ